MAHNNYCHLQKYWNSKVNSFVVALKTIEFEVKTCTIHEMTGPNYSFYFLLFLYRFVQQLGTYHLLYQTTHFLGEQK